MAETEKPVDALARAQQAAREEMESLREKPKPPVRETVLKGFGRWDNAAL